MRELLASPRRAAADRLVSVLVTARAFYPSQSAMHATLARWIYADNVRTFDIGARFCTHTIDACRFRSLSHFPIVFSVLWLSSSRFRAQATLSRPALSLVADKSESGAANERADFAGAFFASLLAADPSQLSDFTINVRWPPHSTRNCGGLVSS